MTEITAYDKNGRVAYHFVTPRSLSKQEIEQDLADMCVEKDKHTIIINGEKYV